MKIAFQAPVVTSRCLLLLFMFLLWSTPALGTDGTYVIDDFSGMDITASDPEVVKVQVDDAKLVLSIDCTEAKQQNVHIPIEHNADKEKVRLSISKAEHIPYMGKFETSPDGRPLQHTFEHNYLVYQKGPVLFSLSNKYHEDLSLYFTCRNSEPQVIGTVQIDKIEIEPIRFIEDRDFAYILAVIILVFLLLPGFLTYSVLYGAGNKMRLLAMLTPMSIGVFVTLYMILLANQQLTLAHNSVVLLSAYIAVNIFLLYWLVAQKKIGVLVANARLIWLEMLATVIVVLGMVAIVTEYFPLPLFNFTYNHLRYFTYDAFCAHDPIFQFVNGIAILYEEPFSKYYANEQLYYGVQDRGMIAGVMYAVVRSIAYLFNEVIANSNGFYTLFGSILNILVLLPVFALHIYFFAGKHRPLLIIFLLSANAFVLTEYYITWFKLAAAGLVISGIVLLLIDRKSIRQWLFVGIIWGLATNFHPSLALTYPVVSLWLLYRFSLERKKRIISVACAFFVLFGSFLVMNLPWTMVKTKYFTDTNVLFRQHFLDCQSYDAEYGIVGSIKKFGGKYTLEEQLSKRVERISRSFRIEEIQSLFKSTSSVKWKDTLRTWSRFETSYIVLVLIPLLVLLAISNIFTQILPVTTWKYPLTHHTRDFRWLLITQVLTIVLIILASFGPYEPDITWHIPMSCMVIVIYLLLHANITIGKIGAFLIVLYSLFSYYRLLYQYF